MRWFWDKVFDIIVSPVVVLILNSVWPGLYNLGQAVLLGIMLVPYWIVTLLEQAVDIFSGVKDITVVENGVRRQTDIVNFFFGQTVVMRIFVAITLISAALCLGFSIIAVIRSMGDLDVRKPVGRVLGTVGKSMLTFLIIPLMCLASVNVASLVLKQTSYIVATSGGTTQPVSTSGALFIIAATPQTLNTSTAGKWEYKAVTNKFVFVGPNTNPDYKKYERVRDDYLYGKTELTWSNMRKMLEDFNIYHLLYPGNYWVSLISGIFYAIMLCMIIFIFLQRIFELIVLFIVAPFFVMSMPLDEGTRFKAWRERFIGATIAGFGSIITLKLVTIFLPLIWDGALIFHSNDFVNTVMKALLTLGGLFATYKMHTMISKIVTTGGGGGGGGAHDGSEASGMALAAIAGGIAWKGVKKTGSAAWGATKGTFNASYKGMEYLGEHYAKLSAEQSGNKNPGLAKGPIVVPSIAGSGKWNDPNLPRTADGDVDFAAHQGKPDTSNVNYDAPSTIKTASGDVDFAAMQGGSKSEYVDFAAVQGGSKSGGDVDFASVQNYNKDPNATTTSSAGSSGYVDFASVQGTTTRSGDIDFAAVQDGNKYEGSAPAPVAPDVPKTADGDIDFAAYQSQNDK
ncbi:MAG: hypothetical protein FWH20_07170 [Oscillospiraceae bacterium]|nr:hypothetical protein [Oscillospiraceae bacterium]